MRVTPTRLALTGLVVLLLGGSLLAGYVVDLTAARPRVVLPSPLSTDAVSGRSATAMSDPGPNSPNSPPGPPDSAGAEPLPGAANPSATSAGSAGPAPNSVDPQGAAQNSPGGTPPSEAAGATAFSPSLCDGPPPDDLPVTPLDGSARGVNGWKLQAGWSYFTDGSGFHVAVPDGWTHQLIGTTHCFRGPRNARTITLDAARDPTTDPLTVARAEETRLAASRMLPGYALVGVDQVPLLNKAADWEYRYNSANGTARHSVFRWFVMGGRAYALGWSTTEKTWTADLTKIRMIRSTFYSSRPTPSPSTGP
ncbi:hypothetical protein Q0Z83_100800 [Actinoplanes sichuanensis]|uniref:Alanine and proline-rich secreted protein Apa n=1 Tax=Actinoplanes sichuanensis TaxID=512349 RepID=A0ABW4AEL1_9ACTN|nr:hypothetical protein [Actinoplanes sichuanensis]BEL11889.1 hypothetical protein Q0Z83_100800 [Actinoplanes sichuanensis]